MQIEMREQSEKYAWRVKTKMQRQSEHVSQILKGQQHILMIDDPNKTTT